jgi:ribonuclease HI
MKLITFTDGGSRGNPGPAAIGGVIYDENENVLAEVSEYIGIDTNNQAEYQALRETLKKARELGATAVDCYLDSELAVKQLNREYKVKNPGLATIYAEILHIVQDIGPVTFTHVYRDKNTAADAQVNIALDAQAEKL